MTALDEVIITMDDVIRAGRCARGAKGWFKEQNLDFRDFLKNGMTATRMLETGDAHAEHVVARKIERELIGVDLTDVIITVEESRAAGRCVIGSKQFAGVNGLDFDDFLKNGVPATTLVATGDPDALAVVRHVVRARANG